MVDRLEELLAVNRAIAGTLDYEELLSLIVDKAAALVSADSCALLLADDQGRARVAAQRGLDATTALSFSAPFDERINTGLRDLLSHAPGDSFLGVPVIHHGSVVGMLVVHWPGAATPGAGDEALLSAFADQVAIALDHASRYRELWHESQRARREIEAASARKDEFLAMLGHELRNPLSAVVSALAVLEAKLPDDPALLRTQQAASRQALHMKRLLDDLLDVSRVTRGKISLDMKPVALADVVSHAVQSVEPLVERRGHELTISVPGTPVYVTGDHDRLVQVITNLLTNAAKYSDPGGRIELSVSTDEEDVEIRVRDRGRGILPDLLPAVFDLFVQAEHGPHRPEGGLGIGLTLARRLVELHDGAIEAHSEGAGRGSEFVIRLPRRHAGQSIPPPAPTPDAVGRNVLLVEDNTDAATTLALLLETLGHEVTVVGDGESALEQLAGAEPDVMLVDLGLPGIDGYEVARRVRRAHSEHPPLLVALTGYGHPTDRRRSRDAGFDHHLVKPVAVAQLERVLAAPS